MNLLFKDIRATVALGFPLVLAQLCMTAMSLVDAIVVGRCAGTEPLAALSFAVNLMNVPFIALFGMTSATSVFAAHAYGGGRAGELASVLRHGLAVCIFLAILATGAILVFFENLDAFGNLGQPAELVTLARPYVYLYAASFVFLIMAGNCRAYCEAQNRPWLSFSVIAGTVLLNAPLDYVLVSGAWGLPRMGLAGAGLATLICSFFQFAALTFVIVRGRLHLTLREMFRPSLDAGFVKKYLALGVPAVAQTGAEIAVMSVIAMFAGRLGAQTLAAHHITIQIASFLFMIPLGMSFAVSIRAGQSAGAGDRPGVRLACRSGMVFVVAWTALSAALLLSLHETLPGIFTRDADVLRLAGSFVFIAALFQVFDGIQCTALGALRGLKDVTFPMIVEIAACWLFHLPLAWCLCFLTPLAGRGIWISYVVMMPMVALLLGLRLKRTVAQAPLGVREAA